MSRPSGVAAAAFVAAVMSVGCSPPSSSTSATSTTDSPSFRDFGSGSAGYEMEILTAGAQPLMSLLVPAPVGVQQSLLATIQTTSSGQPSWVSAGLRVVVERARADGSTDTLRITATQFTASDPLMEEALQHWLGANATVVRGPNRVVEALDWQRSTEQDGTAEANASSDRVEFWVEQLLGATVSFVGPLPAESLGLDATWATTLVDGDGLETRAQHQLTEVGPDNYVIEFASSSDSATWDGLIEGAIGTPVPAHQSIDLGATTILVAPTSSAG